MNLFISHSLEETFAIAEKWLEQITSLYPNLNTALVVGLSGHLGAGKTAYVKALARIVGIQEDITSPTFVIMKNYDIAHGPWKKLVHIDAYRLEKKEELAALQWKTVIADPEKLILIEWPENVGLTQFKPSADIHFEIKEDVHHIEVR